MTDSERDSIRGQYERYGVQHFYEQFGRDYRNPHEPAIREVIQLAVKTWTLDLQKVLDLACGSGEATLILAALQATEIDGIDPYTAEAYRQRTGKIAEPITFEQIAGGVLADRQYTLIVCSFALHLVEESRLPLLALQLSQIAPVLLIVTPHKRPILKPEWGWQAHDELIVDRVRARLYLR